MPSIPISVHPVGKSGPLMYFLVSSPMVMSGADAVDDCGQIVRGEIGGHADCDAGAAIDEEIGERGGKNDRLHVFFVIGGLKIDRVLVDVIHQDGAEMGQARFGITHGRGRVAFDRTEITFTFDEALAHGPGLGHMNQGRVDGLITMRMKLLHRFAHDTGTLGGRPAREQAQLVHGIENPALGGLESVSHIRQGPGDDDRHRIIEKRSADLFRNVDAFDTFAGGKQIFRHNWNSNAIGGSANGKRKKAQRFKLGSP
jgi:hypothetical protein